MDCSTPGLPVHHQLLYTRPKPTFNVHIISSSLRVYKVNFFKRQNGVSLLKVWCKTISASHSEQLKVISCFTNVLHGEKNAEFQKKRWVLYLTLRIWFHTSLRCAWHSDIHTIFFNETSSADTPEKGEKIWTNLRPKKHEIDFTWNKSKKWLDWQHCSSQGQHMTAGSVPSFQKLIS